MVQHMLLLLVAPLLLLAGRPVILALRALPVRSPALARRSAVSDWRRLPARSSAWSRSSAVLLLTHLPAFYDATLRHPALHEAEHALYLIGGAAAVVAAARRRPGPGAPPERSRAAGVPAGDDAADGDHRRLSEPASDARVPGIRATGPRDGDLGGRRPAAGRSDHVGGRQRDHDRGRAVGGDRGAGGRGAPPAGTGGSTRSEGRCREACAGCPACDGPRAIPRSLRASGRAGARGAGADRACRAGVLGPVGRPGAQRRSLVRSATKSPFAPGPGDRPSRSRAPRRSRRRDPSSTRTTARRATGSRCGALRASRRR